MKPDKHKSCEVKKRYDTRKAALFFAKTDGLRAYKCGYCNGFHLTSKGVKSKKRGKK